MSDKTLDWLADHEAWVRWGHGRQPCPYGGTDCFELALPKIPGLPLVHVTAADCGEIPSDQQGAMARVLMGVAIERMEVALRERDPRRGLRVVT